MFSGAMVAIVTPFTDGQVDEESLRSLIEFQIENNTSAIVPVGTTGESATLNHEEHKKVVEITIDQAKKRVPVVAGGGSNNTAEAIELTRHAKQAGADATLQITPYYNKPTQEGIYQHFKALAEEVSLPMVVYNIMGRTAVNIEPVTLARIADLPEAVAVKEASGNLGQMAEMINLCGDKITFLSGDDALTLPLLSIGGKGVISVVSNVAPGLMADLVATWDAGKQWEAQKKANDLLPLCKAMFIEGNPSPVKTALGLMNKITSPELRLPMCSMQPGNVDRLRAVMTQYGLL